MALELIKGERAIRTLKRGAKRLNDGGGLYLLPFASGDSHYWRLDYMYEGRYKMLSLGVHPEVDLLMAREKAAKARATLVSNKNPSQERRQVRSAKAASIQAKNGPRRCWRLKEALKRWHGAGLPKMLLNKN